MFLLSSNQGFHHALHAHGSGALYENPILTSKVAPHAFSDLFRVDADQAVLSGESRFLRRRIDPSSICSKSDQTVHLELGVQSAIIMPLGT